MPLWSLKTLMELFGKSFLNTPASGYGRILQIFILRHLILHLFFITETYHYHEKNTAQFLRFLKRYRLGIFFALFQKAESC